MINFSQPIGIASYQDLLKIKQSENGESFVRLELNSSIDFEHDKRFCDMGDVLPGPIIVRDKVRTLLQNAQMYLRQESPSSRLQVTYGFRTQEIQTDKFLKFLAEESSKEFIADPQELYNRVHMKIAVPTVAGHPTGGAVDVTLIDRRRIRKNMGCEIYDFDGPIETFDPRVKGIAKRNRLLLRQCMMQAGFMPFDGEYWHFSYGDREWAFLKKKTRAPYAQKTLAQAVAMLVPD